MRPYLLEYNYHEVNYKTASELPLPSSTHPVFRNEPSLRLGAISPDGDQANDEKRPRSKNILRMLERERKKKHRELVRRKALSRYHLRINETNKTNDAY